MEAKDANTHANLDCSWVLWAPFQTGSELQETNKPDARLDQKRNIFTAFVHGPVKVVQAPGAICRASTGAIRNAVWWSVQPPGDYHNVGIFLVFRR
jgi:hypothetical protein